MMRSILIIFSLAIVLSCTSQQTQQSPKPKWLWTIEYSPDDKYVAFGGDDSLLRIHTVSDQKLYKSFKLNTAIKGMSWHPESNLLAIATMKGVEIFNLKNETFFKVEGLTTGGRGIKWNRNGQLLGLADGHGVVQIINRDGKLIKSIKKHNNNSYLTLDWHPLKEVIATGTDEIILFDTSGKQLAFFKHRKENTGVLTLRWHPSGEFLASGDYGHDKEGVPTLLQFWKEDGTLLRSMTGSNAEYRNIRWNKDGSAIATASDGLRIWSKDGKLLHHGKTKDLLWGVSWNKDDSKIITASFDGNIYLWTNKATQIPNSF